MNRHDTLLRFCWVGTAQPLSFLLLTLALAHANDAAPFGIEKRTPWTTSHVIGSPDKAAPYRAVRTLPKQTFNKPLWANAEPGTKNLFVIEHYGGYVGPGKILRVVVADNPSKNETILKIDRIIYGIAFDPDYLKNGYIFIGSNGPDSEPKDKVDRISRFTISREAPFACDPKSEVVVLEWPSNGHNGADLAFDNAGMLFITSGDGTSDSDKDNMGQNLGALLSKVLRIDPHRSENGKPYAIPADNPFVGREGTRPETWTYGMRNPWRMSFDKKTNQLWVGQNGQDLWEQVYLIKKGSNYGWSHNEGGHLFQANRKIGPEPITMPTADHHHREARSITGGVVYHGAKFPELDGVYIYGDFSTGKIWGIKVVGEKTEWHREIARTRLQIVGFGLDTAGELLIVDHLGGLYTLETMPVDTNPAKFPMKLSETGLFASVKGHTTEPALIPYSVNAPLWSDGAFKERFIALPGDEQIEATGWRGWNFPDGAVLVKSFAIETEQGNPQSRRHIETRLLTRQNGEWAGYSYLWNDAQTDAELVGNDGADRSYKVALGAGRGTSEMAWHYPSRAECMVCHTRAANWVLGLTEIQMNKVHDYGGVKDNQLRTLEHIGALKVNCYEHLNEFRRAVRHRPLMPRDEFLKRLAAFEILLPGATAAADLSNTNFLDLAPAYWRSPRFKWMKLLGTIQTDLLKDKPARFASVLAKPLDEYKKIVDPGDSKADLTLRARAYLHANCAQCHTDAAGGNSLMNLDFFAEPPKRMLIDATPQHDTFGIPDARLVAPGHPERSVLLHRMSIRGPGQMPQLATAIPDADAVKLIEEWIRSMK